MTAVRPPAGAPGAARRATVADRDLLVSWIRTFAEEALAGTSSPAGDPERVVETRFGTGRGFLPWDDEDEPVSSPAGADERRTASASVPSIRHPTTVGAATEPRSPRPSRPTSSRPGAGTASCTPISRTRPRTGSTPRSATSPCATRSSTPSTPRDRAAPRSWSWCPRRYRSWTAGGSEVDGEAFGGSSGARHGPLSLRSCGAGRRRGRLDPGLDGGPCSELHVPRPRDGPLSGSPVRRAGAFRTVRRRDRGGRRLVAHAPAVRRRARHGDPPPHRRRGGRATSSTTRRRRSVVRCPSAPGSERSPCSRRSGPTSPAGGSARRCPYDPRAGCCRACVAVAARVS